MAAYENGVQLVYGLSYKELILRDLESVTMAFIRGFIFGPFGVLRFLNRSWSNFCHSISSGRKYGWNLHLIYMAVL